MAAEKVAMHVMLHATKPKAIAVFCFQLAGLLKSKRHDGQTSELM